MWDLCSICVGSVWDLWGSYLSLGTFLQDFHFVPRTNGSPHKIHVRYVKQKLHISYDSLLLSSENLVKGLRPWEHS